MQGAQWCLWVGRPSPAHPHKSDSYIFKSWTGLGITKLQNYIYIIYAGNVLFSILDNPFTPIKLPPGKRGGIVWPIRNVRQITFAVPLLLQVNQNISPVSRMAGPISKVLWGNNKIAWMMAGQLGPGGRYGRGSCNAGNIRLWQEKY